MAQTLPEMFRPAPVAEWANVEPPPAAVNRTWLGPAYWANRLQDWRLQDGQVECLAAGPGDEVRTVALLTRELTRPDAPAHLSVRITRLADGPGFAGFLLGAGAGQLDYRAAALVQRASGTGGGLLCVYEHDGLARFREHTDEEAPLACTELESERPGAPTTVGTDVVLQVDVQPEAGANCRVTITVRDAAGNVLTAAVRRQVPADLVRGGLLLVSSPATGKPGARFGFRDVRTAGAAITAHPERAIGPIISTLHSVNGRLMKMTAQLMPVGPGEPRNARLQVRSAGSNEAWRDGALAPIDDGFVAVFRAPSWDATRDHDYRVVYGDATYAGTIRRDPDRERLTLGLVNCVCVTARNLDLPAPVPPLPGAGTLGRYTPDVIAYPFADIAKHVAAHQPDLLVFAGDQIYEGRPTRTDLTESPTLDYLYKWYLWCLSFRELTRSTPAIVQTDDHDVYHGNLWGNGGRKAPDRDPNRGGYRNSAEWVNMVQRTMCGHNPDAFDPTPVDRGITVYYGAFRYGGVSFAVLEDRKFKTAPTQGDDLDVHEAELLGERQERFLEAWAKDQRPNEPKVCLTQTAFACVQTSPTGRPLLDWDANGHPKFQRDTAVRLLREAGALILAGDQHLATVVRHGTDSFSDGPVQFTCPAGASLWARWFEPSKPLPNARGPHTGDWTDAFGNRLRVLAVANPTLSFREYREHRKGRAQSIEDWRLRPDGYAIVHVDRKAREFVLECWPSQADPQRKDARQFAGWPVRVAFDRVRGEEEEKRKR